MAEKLGVGAGVHELKIGDSFFQSLSKTPSSSRNPKKHQGTTFHTIRYDFKPASSSTAEAGFLQVDGDNRGVAVEIPNSGGGQTNYSGHQNPANQKECVLIIDRETGEITLERLSSQLLVKKTRQEKQETPSLPAPRNGQPPVPVPAQKGPQASAKQHHQQANLKPTSAASKASKRQPSKSAQSHQNSMPGSMPLFSLDDENFQEQKTNSLQAAPTAVKDQPVQKDFAAVGTLSSDSSSGSSSSDSDSDSDDSDAGPKGSKPFSSVQAESSIMKSPVANAGMPTIDSMSMPNFSGVGQSKPAPKKAEVITQESKDSDSFSSSEDEDVVLPRGGSGPVAGKGTQRSQQSSMPSVSMPGLLSDDLALSESDSD